MKATTSKEERSESGCSDQGCSNVGGQNTPWFLHSKRHTINSHGNKIKATIKPTPFQNINELKVLINPSKFNDCPPPNGVTVLWCPALLSLSAALPPSSGFSPIHKRVSQTRLKRISSSFFNLTRRLVSFVSQHRQPVRNAYEANGTPRRGRSFVRDVRNIVKRNFGSRSKHLISSVAAQRPHVTAPLQPVRRSRSGKGKKTRQEK